MIRRATRRELANDQAYRELVAEYVRCNIRFEPGTVRMRFDELAAAVKSHGKTLDQFARDWRACEQRMPVSELDD